jgi:hypothetical protein
MLIDRGQENIGKWQETVNEVEEAIIRRHREAAREEMRQAYEEVDRKIGGEMLATGRYVDKGYVRRRIITAVGIVGIRVKRLKRKGRAGSLYPILTAGRVDTISGPARKRCIQAAVGQSYAESQKTLETLAGMTISRMGIWKVVQEAGRAELRRCEQDRKAMFERGEIPEGCKSSQEKAVIEVDGILIGARPEVVESQEVAGRRRMEVKVGVVFCGVHQQSQGRRRTVGRSIHAQISTTEEFAESWYVHCLKHGIDEQTSVHMLGDGAPWIQTVRRETFPESRYTLDLCHLRRNARAVLTERQYGDFSRRIWSGSGTEMIAYIRALRPSDRLHRKELDTFQQYLESNREGLVYRPGKLNGSGVVEKIVDILVARRMKRRGMSWSKEGANNIIALRALSLNRESILWDSRLPSPTF